MVKQPRGAKPKVTLQWRSYLHVVKQKGTVFHSPKDLNNVVFCFIASFSPKSISPSSANISACRKKTRYFEMGGVWGANTDIRFLL